MHYLFAMCLLAGMLVFLSAAISADELTEATPTTPAELQAQLQQLRKYYAPYLRSLPKPLQIRQHIGLSGVWRWKFEVEDLPSGPRPTAPDWYRVDLDDSLWEKTTVPEWRYDKPEPFGTTPDPKKPRPIDRIAWYRTTFAASPTPPDRRAFLSFAGATWEAEIWLNGVFLGRHTAYWEPFRFEVTNLLREHNVLAVRVLAGSNLGEPTFGWTVLPCALAAQPRYERDASHSVIGQRELFGFKSSCFLSGFGIHREVQLETTGLACISEVLARGDSRQNEARIRVETDAAQEKTYTVDIQLLPENFRGKSFSTSISKLLPPGKTTLSLTVPMPGARAWQPADPCLYCCRVIIRDGERTVDARDILFGCRSFTLVKSAEASPSRPEGMFLLNGQPIYLRGADVSAALNAFWYLRQPDKLLDAVLMMKAAHCNALRACEHIQFAEVRELLDRTGMLSEQDVVGHGYSPAPMSVLAELSARAARECYNNPGVVLLTTGGSETNFDPREVVAAVLAVDPERIFKPISGHMENWGTAYECPPGYPTLPKDAWNNVVDDFHCYYGWYRRGVAMWSLSRRYPPARLVTVGEFGVEGLDSYATMQRYPAHLQPPASSANTLWGYAQVKKGDPKLSEGFRGREPRTLTEYIEASQQYQADALAEQATGYRLSPRRIGGYFVFHFVDGLPAEWPKSIVSFDLTPKRAYFALAQINQPVAPLFQITDEGKSLAIWIANDREERYTQAHVAWRLTAGGKVLRQGEQRVDVQPLDATPVSTVDLSPLLPASPVISVELTLSDAAGKPVSHSRREVYLPAYQPPHYPVQPPAEASIPLVSNANGDPNKVDWTHAAVLQDWRQVDGAPTKHVIDAHIAHDGSYLYLKLSEPVQSADLHGEDDVWSGDDWELFFARERKKPYRQLGVNPKGALLDLPTDAALAQCGARAQSNVTPDHWTILLALPLATLVPGGLKSGSVFYGNIYRQAGGGDLYRELLAWSPNYSGSFHQVDRFAKLTLE